MKRILLLLLAVLPCIVFAQTNPSPEDIIRRVADNIIQTTSFQFINSKTNEKFTSTKGKDTSVNVKAESKFNKWQYVNGVLTVGMLRTSSVLNDPKYLDY